MHHSLNGVPELTYGVSVGVSSGHALLCKTRRREWQHLHRREKQNSNIAEAFAH